MLFLADILLLLHFVWVAFVVLSVPLIAIGGILKWHWVRNVWYRRIHLSMMGLVTVEALIGMACPFTVWENLLRESAGEATKGQGFITHYVSRILYYDVDPKIFTIIYVLFLLLIAFLYFKVPPANNPKSR